MVKKRFPAHSFFLIICSLVIAANRLNISAADEVGPPFIHNYSPKDYNAHFQDWAVIQDKRGVMYFGNGYGVLEFDGRYWRTIKLPNHSAVRSLASDAAGVIYVGGVGEFGYLAGDKSGHLSYVSLSAGLPRRDKDFTEVWSILAGSRGVYFKPGNKIFRFYGGRISMIDLPSSPFAALVYDRVFVHNDGIYLLKDDKPLLLPQTAALNRQNTGLLFILPYRGKRLLIAAEKKGFFIYDFSLLLGKNGEDGDLTGPYTGAALLEKFPTEIDDFILENRLYACETIAPNRYAFGTTKGGIVVMDQNGKLERVIGKHQGLQKNNVLDLFVDKRQNLWAALNNGISHIEINSPITWFSENSGLEDIVLTAARHKKKLYVGAFNGLFCLNDYTPVNLPAQPYFLPVKNIGGSCWDLLATDWGLFVAGNFGVVRIADGKQLRFQGNKLVYCFGRSERFPDHIFMGGRNELTALKIGPGKRIDYIGSAAFKDVIGIIRLITDDNRGNLWLTNQYNGVSYIMFTGDNIADHRVFHFGISHGLPQLDWNRVYRMGERIIVATQKGLYEAVFPHNSTFDPAAVRFVPENTFGKIFSQEPSAVSQFFIDKRGDIWINSEKGLGILSKSGRRPQPKKSLTGHLPAHLLVRRGIPLLPGDRKKDCFFCTLFQDISKKRDGSYSWDMTPFQEIKGDVQDILLEEKGIAWVCTNDGLFRCDMSIEKDYKVDYHTLIRKVVRHDGMTIYDGAGEGVSRDGVPAVAYKHNSLTFVYAAAFYEHPGSIRFKYILEGYDKEWSAWTPETKKEYTNLAEGRYCFKVTARNIFGRKGSTAAYSFIIEPPWHRTLPAYIGYSIGLLAIIVLALLLHFHRVKQAVLFERRKYEKTFLDPQKAEEYVKKLIHYMEKERPYLDTGIDINFLADELGIPAYHLSQVLNDRLKKNFYDFVNEYRVEEAKRRLSAVGLKETILQIAFDVGFNSNAAFSRVFKKHTGMSPLQYRKKGFPS